MSHSFISNSFMYLPLIQKIIERMRKCYCLPLKITHIQITESYNKGNKNKIQYVWILFESINRIMNI